MIFLQKSTIVKESDASFGKEVKVAETISFQQQDDSSSVTQEAQETSEVVKSSPKTSSSSAPKPIIRESKLVLNQKLLEDLRNPEEQVEFYHAIQKSMQNAENNPPKLVEGVSSMINPGKF